MAFGRSALYTLSIVYLKLTSYTKQDPNTERWGAGVEYHFQEFNEPYAPS